VRYGWSLALVCLLASPAIAGWESKGFMDNLNNKKSFFAGLAAKDGSATLFVGCLYGELFPDIHFPSRLGEGQVEVSYQFDEDPLMQRVTNLSPDGNALWLWLISGREMAQKIRKSKRLRMEVNNRPIEFDLTGADQAIAPIHCY